MSKSSLKASYPIYMHHDVSRNHFKTDVNKAIKYQIITAMFSFQDFFWSTDLPHSFTTSQSSSFSGHAFFDHHAHHPKEFQWALEKCRLSVVCNMTWKEKKLGNDFSILYLHIFWNNAPCSAWCIFKKKSPNSEIPWPHGNSVFHSCD